MRRVLLFDLGGFVCFVCLFDLFICFSLFMFGFFLLVRFKHDTDAELEIVKQAAIEVSV